MAEATTQTTAVDNTAKTPVNVYDNKREVMVYKHRQFVIVEVEKEKIDNICEAVENAKNNIDKGAISSDVVLGFSTAFFGGFLGCISDIIKMVSSNKITMIIFLYFALLTIAIILFFIYRSMDRKKRVDTAALIERIALETKSISNGLEILDNEISENTPPENFNENVKTK